MTRDSDNPGATSERREWQTVARRPAVAYWVLTVLFILVLGVSGVSARDAVATTAVILISTAGGGVLWRLVRRSGTALASEILGMGIALGGLLFLVGHLAFRVTPLLPWGGVVLPILVLLSTLAPRVRQAVTKVEISPVTRGEAIAVGLGLLLGLFLMVPFWLRHPLSFDGWFAYYVDIPYHEALSRSLALWGPNENALAVGQDIRYHWFSHGWVGGLTQIVSAEPFVALTRVLPLWALLGLSSLGYAWVRLLTNRDLPGIAAVVLLLAGVHLGSPGFGLGMVPESPSHVFEFPVVLATMVALSHYLAGRLHFGPVVLFALGAASAGAKANSVPVILAGVGLAIMVLWRKPVRHSLFLAFGALTAGMAAVIATVVAGSSNGFSLAPGRTPLAYGFYAIDPAWSALQTALVSGVGIGLVALACGAAWAGIAVLLVGRRTRLVPEVWIGAGAALSAFALAALLNQPGVSQLYFILSAAIICAPISAWGIATIPEDLKKRRRWIAVLVTVGVVLAAGSLTLVRLGANALGVALPWLIAAAFGGVMILTRRRSWGVDSVSAVWSVAVVLVLASVTMAIPLGAKEYVSPLRQTTVAEQDSYNAWSPQHREALNWLRDNAPMQDIVATNRFCSVLSQSPPECDSRWFLVGALSEHRVLLEGYSYSVGLGELPDWALTRVRAVTDFIDTPSASSAQALKALGVGWVFVDKGATEARNWAPWASVEFSNEVATVLRLR